MFLLFTGNSKLCRWGVIQCRTYCNKSVSTCEVVRNLKCRYLQAYIASMEIANVYSSFIRRKGYKPFLWLQHYDSQNSFLVASPCVCLFVYLSVCHSTCNATREPLSEFSRHLTLAGDSDLPRSLVNKVGNVRGEILTAVKTQYCCLLKCDDL